MEMDPREFLENFLRGGQTLHTEIKRYSIEEGEPDQEAFVREKKTSLDEAGSTIEEEHIRLYQCKCGNIVGAWGAGELWGKCQRCNSWICRNCRLRCQRCLTLLCPACARLYKDVIYCRPCKIKLIAKNVLFLGFTGFHAVMSKNLTEKS